MRSGTLLAVLLSVGLVTGVGRAADLPTDQEQVTHAPFSVEAVDRADRKLVLQSPGGGAMTVRVASTVDGFDQLKKGDEVQIDYFLPSVVSLDTGAASSRLAMAERTEPATRANSPTLGAAGGREITTRARVTAVDEDTGMLQIRTRDGLPQTLLIGDPKLRTRLRSVGEGDRVTVTYIEPVAVALTMTGR
jgi:hypothetical protein